MNWCEASRNFPNASISGESIRKLMRAHRVPIRGLSESTGITMKRIREVRESGVKGPHLCRDWVQAITGTDPGNTLDHPSIRRAG